MAALKELRQGQHLLRQAVFGASTRHLIASPGHHVLRTHEREKVSFFTLPPERPQALLRYLKLFPLNVNAVVTEKDMVDLFMDLEMKGSTSHAARYVLSSVVEHTRALLEELLGSEDPVQRLLVLDASGAEFEKQSMHLHFRLDRPVASRKDVRAFLQLLRRRLPGPVGSWLDLQPATSGSLRVMHAVTVSGVRPLVPLDLSTVPDPELRAYLEAKAPDSEVEMMEMALLKRFSAQRGAEEHAYQFVADEQAGKEKTKRHDWKSLTREFNADMVLDGTLERMLAELPIEVAEDFEPWHSAMWACKSIGGVESEDEAYRLFDDFSSQSTEKYTPEKNRRAWDSMTAGQPKAGYYTLRRLSRLAL